MSGARGTASGIALPPREAIRFLLGKTNTPTQRWSDVWQEAHARSFMVAGAASDALLADFRTAVAKALEQGTTLAEFRRDFDAIVARNGWAHTGTPGWRATIIYETNLSMAYAAGRHAQMTEPGTLAVFPYWQYVHSGAENPRLQHLAWNGLVLRADDGFWATHYPPNGWRCGCRVRPLSARDLARQGRTGPDQAPEVVMRPWTRPSDGAQLMVPEGIDPGFGYNVGEAWAQRRPVIPEGARLTPPAGFPPPPPGGAVPATASPPPLPRQRAAPPAGDDLVVFRPEVPEPSSPLPPPPALPLATRTPIRRQDASPELRAQDRQLRTLYAPWASELTEPEREAIRHYRIGGMALNRVLREPALATPEAMRSVDTLRAALLRAAAPIALTVRRGVSLEEAAALGRTGTLPAFTSTTLDAATARDFAARREGVLLEIRIPAGMTGVGYVHNIPTTRPAQFEVLLAPGLRYRVVRRTRRLVVLEIEP